MVEAEFYETLDNAKVRCELCPHACLLSPNEIGICKSRKNISGKLITLNYGVVSSMNLDPIEKKPLYKFYPGSMVLSIGSLGCNLKCTFCQNWKISTISESAINQSQKNVKPFQIIDLAQRLVPRKNIGVAYTYNEPIVWFEYMKEIAESVKENNLKNVMVSNGFIQEKPLDVLVELMDAFNIDLKSYDMNFYKKITKSSIDPVINTLKRITKSQKHLEISYLVIPGKNDNPEHFAKMVKWIQENLGKDIVLHINRYFPSYRMKIPQTSMNSLHELSSIARESLSYVYMGNV